MKGLVTVAVLILLTEGSGFIHWLETHLLACPFKKLTGIDCPGCGLQRSFVALLKGDIGTSLKFYPATLPIMALMIFTLLHLKLEFKNGALIIKGMYILATAIILISYIYKVYHQQLF
jgi:hypothetical protein